MGNKGSDAFKKIELDYAKVVAEQTEELKKFIYASNMIMYGPESEAKMMRYKTMTLEEFYEIPMTPSTADVFVSSNFVYKGSKPEQLLMDTEGYPDDICQDWVTERTHDGWFKIDFLEQFHVICGFGIKSPSDEPSADPTSVKVSYFDITEDKMVQIAEFEVDFEGKRNRTLKFKIPPILAKDIKFDLHHDNHFHISLNRVIFYTPEEELPDKDEN